MTLMVRWANNKTCLDNLITGTNIPIKVNVDEEQTKYKRITKEDYFYCELEMIPEK